MKVDRALVDRLDREVVGRRRELEVLVAALAADRHMRLEGPPGTGKSTVLRSLAEATGAEFVFVEGNAELTPSRFVGTFDPAQVLAEGYSPEAFVDGPLITALREGALLYVEEINRVPEETLNVLITVMSEGELHVPRLGRVGAAEGFRLVAAMNPFDSVGTARISAAIYDRMCRITMGYQDAATETRVVLREVPGADPDFVAKVVTVVRATRDHPSVRIGSSVRGAIDLVLLAGELGGLRGTAADHFGTGLDAALAALSGRLRVFEGGEHQADDIVRELWAAVFDAPSGDGHANGDGDREGDPGKV
jgi:MoxR-like ATPase